VARLIAQRLETPPNVPESDDELDVADKNSDENKNNKQTATQKTITEPEQTATQKLLRNRNERKHAHLRMLCQNMEKRYL